MLDDEEVVADEGVLGVLKTTESKGLLLSGADASSTCSGWVWFITNQAPKPSITRAAMT